jgi:hypothetical protein
MPCIWGADLVVVARLRAAAVSRLVCGDWLSEPWVDLSAFITVISGDESWTLDGDLR